MIPYMLSFLIIAIPLASAEWALGRCGGKLGYHSPFGVYYAVSNKSRFWGLCGGLTSLTPLVIGMYYIFVEAWCLLYALQYLGGLLEHCGLGFSLLKSTARARSRRFGRIQRALCVLYRHDRGRLAL